MTRLEEIAHKLSLVRGWLTERSLPGICLSTRWNFSWLTAGGSNCVNAASEVGVATLLVTADKAVCLTNRIESTRMRAEECGLVGIDVIEFDWFDGAATAAALAEHVPSGSVADVMIPGLPDGVALCDSSFDALRFTLIGEEVERWRDIGRRTAQAIDHASKTFAAGITERQLAGLVSQATWDAGAQPWVVLIASDDRIAKFRHPIATDKPIDRHAMIVLCAERNGLICSATRMIHFGEIDAELRRRHEACCRVDAAFNAASRDGRTLGDVFAIGSKAYAAEGFEGEWQLHHQGGLAGYRPREVVGTPDDKTPIQSPAVFAWNPSITGTKSEDTLLVSDAGHELITLSRDWPMITCEAEGVTFERPAILQR